MSNTDRTSHLSILMTALLCAALAACGGGGSDTTAPRTAASTSTSTSTSTPQTPTQTPTSDPVPLPVTRLNKPNGIARDALGDFYVADQGNFTVRKITSAGVVSTLAGTPGQAGTRDGLIITDGVTPTAQFTDLRAIAVHRTPDSPTDVMAPATIYLIDGNTVRKIPLDNDLKPEDEIVETIIGSDKLANPTGIAVEQNGTQTFYITDAGGVTSSGVVVPPRIIKVDNTGVITNFVTGLLGPRGIALDTANNLFITDVDPGSGATLIKKVTPTGVVSTLSGAGLGQSFTNGGSIAVNAAGHVVFTTPTSIVVLAADGTPTTVPVNAAKLVSLSGITFDTDGTNFVVTDRGNHTVSKVTTAGALTPYVGAPGQPGSIDSPGVSGPQINN